MATGKGRNRTPRRAIETRKREAEILELRYQGTTVVEIGQRYGISAPRVSKIYYRALARIAGPIAELERKRALEVVDRALAALWSMVKSVDDPPTPEASLGMLELGVDARLRALLAILRWEEYRSRLLGLFDVELPAPAKVEQRAGLSESAAEYCKFRVFYGDEGLRAAMGAAAELADKRKLDRRAGTDVGESGREDDDDVVAAPPKQERAVLLDKAKDAGQHSIHVNGRAPQLCPAQAPEMAPQRAEHDRLAAAAMDERGGTDDAKPLAPDPMQLIEFMCPSHGIIIRGRLGELRDTWLRCGCRADAVLSKSCAV
jgi:DNA-binding CsgD family transcriptional regulator